ncbi:hypothetical protein AQUCO_01800210v1 [Aquilegia coerulea]|uniref:Uncharacterized protein n=1 Tax=Aquilegia coerulea TaxID=218851 RepID=A0A2G5DKE9_AQUCA|nr:hypothetical protein AQUCO_01800210v1 [Aquilegia coerulea]
MQLTKSTKSFVLARSGIFPQFAKPPSMLDFFQDTRMLGIKPPNITSSKVWLRTQEYFLYSYWLITK